MRNFIASILFAYLGIVCLAQAPIRKIPPPVIQSPMKPNPVSQRQMAFKIPDIVTPKEPYTSDRAKIDYLQEQNLQLQSKVLADDYQQKVSQLQSQFNTVEDAKRTWVEKVKSDNGWDDTYSYDWEKDQWTHTAKEPDKKADTKVPEANKDLAKPAAK